MRLLGWKAEKNEKLKAERGLSFEQIEEAIANGALVSVLKNEKHPNQVVLVIEIEGYMIAVPTLVKPDVFFFMTAYRSRELTKRFGRKT